MEDISDLVERLDHTALAVHDVAEAAGLLRSTGGEFFEGGDSTHGDFRWVQFVMPAGAKLELIAPRSPRSFLTSFLSKRGEGLHHVTLKVTDLAQAVTRLESIGHRIVGHVRLHDNWAEAFVHPSSAHGTLIQLAEWDDAIPSGSSDWDAVIRGDVVDDAPVDDR